MRGAEGQKDRPGHQADGFPAKEREKGTHVHGRTHSLSTTGTGGRDEEGQEYEAQEEDLEQTEEEDQE